MQHRGASYAIPDIFKPLNVQLPKTNNFIFCPFVSVQLFFDSLSDIWWKNSCQQIFLNKESKNFVICKCFYLNGYLSLSDQLDSSAFFDVIECLPQLLIYEHMHYCARRIEAENKQEIG